MKKIFITLTLFLAAPVFAAVELDTDRNGATDISRGGTNSTTTSGAKANLGIPSTLSALAGDTTHRVVTDAQIGIWDSKQPALTAGTDYLTPNGSAAGLDNFPTSLATDSEVSAAVAGKEPTLGNPTTSGWCLQSTDGGVRSWGVCGSGSFDPTIDATITGDWTFSSGLEASNVSLNLGSLADLKIGNAQMFDDTKGSGVDDEKYAWSAKHTYDQLSTKQPLDSDLTLAAGATGAGNSKYFGTNSSGTAGFFDLPSGGSGTSGYVSLSAAPYSDVACTTGQYGYYGSTAYLCTGGFWTSKWTLSTHDNLSPSSCNGLFRSGSTESFESGSGTFCTTDAWSETDTINAIDTYSTAYHNCGIHSASIIIDADNASAPLLTANLGSGQTDFYHRFYFYVPTGTDQSFTLARYAEVADGSNYSLSVKATYDGVNSWIVRARVDGVDTDESFSLPQGAGYRMEAHVVRGAGTYI